MKEPPFFFLGHVWFENKTCFLAMRLTCISYFSTEYQSLLDKYQTVILTKETNQHEHLEEAKNAARTEAERDLLKKQLQEAEHKLQKAVDDRERASQMLKEVEHRLERAEDDRERTNQMLKEVEQKFEMAEIDRERANKLLREEQHRAERRGEDKERTNRNLADVEHRLQRVMEEKERSDRALVENNKELREMEKSLTGSLTNMKICNLEMMHSLKNPTSLMGLEPGLPG